MPIYMYIFYNILKTDGSRVRGLLELLENGMKLIVEFGHSHENADTLATALSALVYCSHTKTNIMYNYVSTVYTHDV